MAVVRELAARQHRPFEELVAELSRGGFQESEQAPTMRNGVPLLQGRYVVTPELVDQLRDDLP